MYYKSAFIFLLVLLNNTLSQEIPSNLFSINSKKIKFDAGKNWEKNSTIDFFPYFATRKDLVGNIDNSILGLNKRNKENLFYGHHRFKVKSNFNVYLNGYLKSKINLINDQEKRVISISNTSGLKFSNDWLQVQFGKGTQGWGANHDIGLGINKESEPYNYGALGLDFGILRVKYFHGFLEKDLKQNNRFLTGRGIEFTNNKSIVMGLSEIVVYSGHNRTIDLSYFNPISTHLEIEMNDRTNLPGTGNGNGVWQIFLDFFISSRFRISGNYLVDEFVLDQEQKDASKASGNAYSYKLVYSPQIRKRRIISFYYSKIKIGTYTFRHQNGSNNFVQLDRPLGSGLGSDSAENKFGLTIMALDNFLTFFNFGLLKIGENSITNNPYLPYTDYKKVPFPSGANQTISFLSNKFQYLLKNKYCLSYEIRFEKNRANNSTKKESLLILFADISIPIDNLW